MTMKRTNKIVLILLINLLILALPVLAESQLYDGDGTYNLKVGDSVKATNGYTVKLSLAWGEAGRSTNRVDFDIYDFNGHKINTYTRFGVGTILTKEDIIINVNSFTYNPANRKEVDLVSVTISSEIKKLVTLFVDESTYSQLKYEIDRYTDDIKKDLNASTHIFHQDSWNSTEIREQLIELYNNSNLIGAIFIGRSIPSIEYDNDYRNLIDSTPLNEIWTARIVPPIDDMSLLQEYFDRNHRERFRLPYRENGEFLFFNTFFLYSNNNYDASCNYTELTQGVIDKNTYAQLIYNESECSILCTINASNAEIAKDIYLNELQDNSYEFIFFYGHGDPNREFEDYTKHYISPNVYISYTDIKNASPKAEFYYLVSCSTGNWHIPDYIAGWYLFAGDGLVVKASVLVTQVIPPEVFIKALSVGGTVGEASKYELGAEGAGYMGILGDPTLRLRPKPSKSELRIKHITYNPAGWENEDVEIKGKVIKVKNYSNPRLPFNQGYIIIDDTDEEIMIYISDLNTINTNWLNKTISVKGKVKIDAEHGYDPFFLYIAPDSVSLYEPRECAKEGEKVNRNPLLGPIDKQCCPSLTEIRVSKSYSVCVNCGDGICKDPEDQSNCPRDCGAELTECEKKSGYCIDWQDKCKEGYIGSGPMDCPQGRSAQCCIPEPLIIKTEANEIRIVPGIPIIREGVQIKPNELIIEKDIQGVDERKRVAIKQGVERILIESKNISATTKETLEFVGDRLFINTVGERKPIKIMPDVASEKAIENAGLHNIERIELKDVGKPVYIIKGNQKAKLFLIIPIAMDVEVNIDSENGDIVSIIKPWWSFLVW